MDFTHTPIHSLLGPEGWHAGSDFLAPGFQLLSQLAGALRHLCGQAAALGGIVFQVVELERGVLVALDQLPVSLADGASGEAALVAVVRVVPEERLPAAPASLEDGNQAFAVLVQPGAGGQTGSLEQRGKEIRAGDEGVADRAGPDLTGPA